MTAKSSDPLPYERIRFGDFFMVGSLEEVYWVKAGGNGTASSLFKYVLCKHFYHEVMRIS